VGNGGFERSRSTKAAHDFFETVGLDPLPVDVDASGDPGILLPEPGFCTTALRYAVRARGNGSQGEAGHAH
jgi:hypothetical protein